MTWVGRDMTWVGRDMTWVGAGYDVGGSGTTEEGENCRLGGTECSCTRRERCASCAGGHTRVSAAFRRIVSIPVDGGRGALSIEGH